MLGCLLLGVGSSAAGFRGAASVLADDLLSSVPHGRSYIAKSVTVQCIKIDWILRLQNHMSKVWFLLDSALIAALILRSRATATIFRAPSTFVVIQIANPFLTTFRRSFVTRNHDCHPFQKSMMMV